MNSLTRAYRVINYVATPEEMFRYTTELFSLVENGTIKIIIHKEYPFTADGVKQSQRDITEKGTTGKLVIKVLDQSIGPH